MTPPPIATASKYHRYSTSVCPDTRLISKINPGKPYRDFCGLNDNTNELHRKQHEFVEQKLALFASQLCNQVEKTKKTRLDLVTEVKEDDFSLNFEFGNLPRTLREYIEQKINLTKAKDVYVCNGSKDEFSQIVARLKDMNMIQKLDKLDNCWLTSTDPRDTARVESKTFICTRNSSDMIPDSVLAKQELQNNPQIIQNSLGNWMHVDTLDSKLDKLLNGCMAGRTMFVIPFSMGKIGGKSSKIGVQLTDSAYVVASMHIMTHISSKIFTMIPENDNGRTYVKCFHSVGCPLPLLKPLVNNWPCDPDNTLISHVPERNEIISYGSGYGGNSLLGKKCFALRFGTILGSKEGWLAEHMLILSIKNKKTQKTKYIAAAFPSACGKTNLAMLNPPKNSNYVIKTVGDDIMWMRRDRSGVCFGTNPEKGFFGVAPGTSEFTNPNAMKTITKNTIFTNVAKTSDGDVYWQGMEHRVPNYQANNIKITSWLGNKVDLNSKEDLANAAHPNSRFCAPIEQCPSVDVNFDSEVPISAILFGTRRPKGVPLVFESFNWEHGVYLGASMRSETTAAAEFKAGKSLMHDPMAQRPFLGVKFTTYLKNWLKFGKQTNNSKTNTHQQQQTKNQMPKIFHVNWFRKDSETGEFLWPGFGENIRVLDYIFRRIDDEECAVESPIGYLPKKGAINIDGLSEQVDLEQLLSVDKQFWLDEQQIIDEYLRENDAPNEILKQSEALKLRLSKKTEN